MKGVSKVVAVSALTALGTWVLGSLTGVGEHLGNPWAADSRLVLVWTACALVVGLACGCVVARPMRIRSGRAIDREMLDLICGPPPQLLSIVRRVYDKDEAMASPLDQHVQMLENMRVRGGALRACRCEIVVDAPAGRAQPAEEALG